MEFSVVVPFLDAEEHIERCVRALVAQSFPADRYEILMVDNNSRDESARIVREFERVKLLQEKEQGSYAARNTGIRDARGGIVAFTDPDCAPREDWLEQIGRVMADDPSIGLVLGGRRFASDAGILGRLAAYESQLLTRVFESRQVDCYYGYTNNMAVRKSILTALGGFRQVARGADTLFLRQVVGKYGSSGVKYAPDVQVRHFEIAGIGDYLHKKTVYGQVNRNPELAPPNSLKLKTRLALALEANRQCGVSLTETAGFFGVLATGAIRFEWERRRSGRA